MQKMESNRNKILTGIALVIALAPLKLAISAINIWFLVLAIVILICIYFLFNKPEFIGGNKYYNSIAEDIHDKAKENQDRK